MRPRDRTDEPCDPVRGSRIGRGDRRDDPLLDGAPPRSVHPSVAWPFRPASSRIATDPRPGKHEHSTGTLPRLGRSSEFASSGISALATFAIRRARWGRASISTRSRPGKYFVEPHILSFAQFDRWADKRVLEIGCGIGTDTINFARAGYRVTAVDPSERSLDLARRRAVVCGLDRHHVRAR